MPGIPQGRDIGEAGEKTMTLVTVDDEVWLSLGRNPVLSTEQKDLNVESARGAVLALAGLIEMQGGRVSFATDPDTPVDLHVNMGATTFEAIVVLPQIAKDQWSFIVPEPIGSSRILAVVTPQERGPIASACLSVIDLTEAGSKGYV